MKIRLTLAVMLLGFSSLVSAADQWVGWGKNDNGQALTPILDQPQSIADGIGFFVAVKKDGTLYSWLVSPVNSNATYPVTTEILNVPPGTFTAVSAANAYAVAIRTDGTLVAWGINSRGVLSTPSGTFKAVSAGRDRAVALRTDGTAVSWGHNPEIFPQDKTFIAIDTGDVGAYGLDAAGKITRYFSAGGSQTVEGTYKSFSTSDYGGFVGIRTDGTVDLRGTYQVPPQGLPAQAVAVMTSRWFTQGYAVLGLDGKVASNLKWLDGTYTQLSGGLFGRRPSGEWVSRLANAPFGYFGFLTGTDMMTFGIRSDNFVAAYGRNQAEIPGVDTPQPGLPTLSVWSDGWTTGVIYLLGGTLYASGKNPEPGPFKAVAGSNYLISALREDGSVATWGNAPPPGTFTAISGQGPWAVGIRSNGTLLAWGSSAQSGQLSVPPGTFKAVAAGFYHGVAIRTDGTLACWGANNYSQRSFPPGKFKAVAAGWNHSVAVREDGVVFAWGDNRYGQCNVPNGVYFDVAAGSNTSFARRAISPTAHPDSYQALPNQTRNGHPSVLQNDIYATSAVLANQALHGEVVLNSNGTFTYQPDTNFVGTDSFTYRAASEEGQSAPATVTLHVAAATFVAFAVSPENLWIPQHSGPGDIASLNFTVDGYVPQDTQATFVASSYGAVSWPTSVPIPAGSGERAFGLPITSQGPWYTDNSPVTVRGTFAGVTRTATFKRWAKPKLVSAQTSFSTTSLFETNETVLTVKLDRPAPIYGAKVRVFAIEGTSVFKFPNTEADAANPPLFPAHNEGSNTKGAILTVPAGATSAQMAIGIRWSGDSVRKITIEYGGVSTTRTIQIKGLVPVSVTSSSSNIDTPADATLTVGLNGTVGPVRYQNDELDAYYWIYSDAPEVIGAPAWGNVTSGHSSGAVSIHAAQVSASRTVTIRVERNNVSKTVTVQLNP